MRTILLYLWKEWRDHRALLLGFLVAVPAVLGAARAALPADYLSGPDFAAWCCLLGLATVALAIASDLVPGEARRGKLDFLRRVPAGLNAAWWGKTLFLALVLAALPAYAWWMAKLFGGTAREGGVVELVPSGYCLALWTFVVSCWLPRGSLALPAAGLVIALLLLPAALVYLLLPGLGVVPDALATLRWILVAGAFPVAWLSFARGRRAGRGIGAAALRGLPAAAVLFFPAWIYAAVEHHDYYHFDPRCERAFFTDGMLGEGGRFLYLNGYTEQRLGFDPDDRRTRNYGLGHGLVVDLRTGGHRVVGSPGDVFVWRGTHRGLPWFYARHPLPARVVALRDFAQTLHAEGPRRTSEREWLTYFDARTARPVAQGWSDMRFAEVERLDPDSGPDVPEGFRIWGAPRGLGYAVYDDKHRRQHFWDPFRGKVYSARELRRFAHPLIRPGRWLAMVGGKYELFEPDTLAHEATRGTPIHSVRWILDDGRAVIAHGGRMVVIDPETGAEQAFGPPGCSGWWFGRTPGGAYCVRFEGPEERNWRHARVDAETLEPAYARGLDGADFFDFQLIAVVDEDTMIGIYKRRQVVRVRFGSDERTVLWPR